MKSEREKFLAEIKFSLKDYLNLIWHLNELSHLEVKLLRGGVDESEYKDKKAYCDRLRPILFGIDDAKLDYFINSDVDPPWKFMLTSFLF